MLAFTADNTLYMRRFTQLIKFIFLVAIHVFEIATASMQSRVDSTEAQEKGSTRVTTHGDIDCHQY